MSDLTQQPDPTPRPAFARDLASLYEPGVGVPAEVDRAVLGDAGAYLARHNRRRRVMRWSLSLGTAAAAASIAVAVFVNRPDRAAKQLAAAQGSAQSIPGDVNGDG